MKANDFKTLEEAKQFIRDNFQEGSSCPCCGQFVKLYKRKLTSGMAKALINLYYASSRSTKRYIHITDLGHLNGGEFAQLQRWGLIVEQPNEDEEKRTSGMWAITYDGMSFVEKLRTVPSHVYTYNGKTIKFSVKETNIEQALGNKFHYTELMSK